MLLNIEILRTEETRRKSEHPSSRIGHMPWTEHFKMAKKTTKCVMAFWIHTRQARWPPRFSLFVWIRVFFVQDPQIYVFGFKLFRPISGSFLLQSITCWITWDEVLFGQVVAHNASFYDYCLSNGLGHQIFKSYYCGSIHMHFIWDVCVHLMHY
jgi:hypothetical protein